MQDARRDCASRVVSVVDIFGRPRKIIEADFVAPGAKSVAALIG